MPTPTLHEPTRGDAVTRHLELKERGVRELARRIAIICAEDELLMRRARPIPPDEIARLELQTVKAVKQVVLARAARNN